MSAVAPRRFRLRNTADGAQLVSGLLERAPLAHDGTTVATRELLDTFDWRLHRAGSALELRREEQPEAPAHLLWRSLETGEVLGRVEVDAPPRFSWDLPPGPVTDRLAAKLDVRALLVLAKLRSEITSLRMVDDEGKALARVVVDHSVLDGGRELEASVEIAAVRGYQEEADRLAELLAAQVMLSEGGDDVAVEAFRAAGHTPGDYSSKLSISLDPDLPASRAWADVLHVLLGTMRANEAGLRDRIDSEFLHDFRVAVRRTRTVLAQGKGVLDPKALERFRDDFAWLGQLTGPTRDLDVYLLEIPQLARALPATRRSDLKPFEAFLESSQRTSQSILIDELEGPRYASMITDWQAFLGTLRPGSRSAGRAAGPRRGTGRKRAAPDPAVPDATRPVTSVAGERIRRAHRRLVHDGRRIGPGSHPEALHDLRKDGKKLRYLLECFGGLYPSGTVGPLVKELKALQDVLGEYQDCQVQSGSIERFGDQMLDDAGARASTLIAMGLLVDQLHIRESAARSAFDDRFAAFDSRAVRNSVAAISELGAAAEAGSDPDPDARGRTPGAHRQGDTA